MLTEYISYAEVRAVLGVSPKEIPDSVIGLDVYEQQFLLDMEDVDQGGGQALLEFARITALDPGTRTADEARYLVITRLVAGYHVAQQLLGSISMFAPQTIQDGKAKLDRFDDPFDSLRNAVAASYAKLLQRLRSLLLILVPGAAVPTATVRRFISSVGLGTDPITGV